MDENLRTKLITLYATRDVAEIEDSSEHLKKLFGSDREALLGNNELIELKQTIKEQKESLELCEQRYKKKHAKPLGDSKEQVIECLKLLLNKATFTTAAETLYQRQMDILYRLVIERYCKRVPWPPDLREHFDFLYPKIRDWNLFFLSYTNEGVALQQTVVR